MAAKGQTGEERGGVAEEKIWDRAMQREKGGVKVEMGIWKRSKEKETV